MPVLILRIVAILIPLVGAIIYVRKITKKTKGKKLIVLGKKATGKSSLVQLLAEGTIPEGHVNHAGVRKFIPKIKAEDLGLHLSEEEPIEDWPGENEHREKGWQMTLPEKDLIIYLFRADHLLANGNDGKRIRADIMSVSYTHLTLPTKRIV